MLRPPGTFTVWMFMTVFTVCAVASAAPQQKAKARRARKPAVVAQVAPPPAPELPKTPVQLPPVAPTVTYSSGLLSIDAPNSNLSDVLAGVRRATGANIEGGGSERIVAHIGPGRPRDVLSSLLQGSRYDFIILGPKGDPTGVQRVMLMARGGAGSEPLSNAGVQPQPGPAQPAPRSMPQAANTNPDEDEENNAEPEEVSPKGQMTPEPEGPPAQVTPEQENGQPQPNAAPQQAPGAAPPQAQDQQQQQQQGPQVKSPEQLFKELQELQQQRQQQQQQNPR